MAARPGEFASRTRDQRHVPRVEGTLIERKRYEGAELKVTRDGVDRQEGDKGFTAKNEALCEAECVAFDDPVQRKPLIGAETINHLAYPKGEIREHNRKSSDVGEGASLSCSKRMVWRNHRIQWLRHAGDLCQVSSRRLSKQNAEITLMLGDGFCRSV